MRYALLLLLLFYHCFLYAQVSTVLQETDALILEARYADAVTKVDQQISSATNASLKFQLLNRKAEALTRMGKFEDATELIRTIEAGSKTSPDSVILLAITERNKGFLFLNQGRNDLAIEALNQSIERFDRSGKSDGLDAALAVSFMGQVYVAEGKNTQAEEQMQMALALRSQQLPKEHELIAASLNDLGFVYSQIDLDKALDYYEKALAMYTKLHGADHPKLGLVSTNIGVVYYKMGLYGDAVSNLENALRILDKAYPQPHPSKGFALFNLGITYLQMNNRDAALGYYERALKMYRDCYGAKHPEISGVLNAIGDIKLSQQHYDEALSYFQQALIANISNFESTDPLVNPSTENYYSGNVMLYSVMYKARTYEAIHIGKTLKFSDLELALTNLSVCDTLIDKLRQRTSNEADKIALGAIANEVYQDGVRIAFTMGDVALPFHKEIYRERAFYFAEKSKSAVLLASISESDAKSFANIPASLLEEEKSLKAALALTAQRLAQKPPAEEEVYLRETSFTLNKSYQDFVKNLESQYPEYFNLKFNTTAPSMRQIQNLLDDQTALISYFIDEKNKRLYTFLITHKRFTVSSKGLTEDLNRQLTGFRNSIYFRDWPTYITAGRTLYDLIIPKGIHSNIVKLIIVPTGRMGVIPFEALLTKDINTTTEAKGYTLKRFTETFSSSPAVEDQDYASLPFLVNRFTISYEFAAALLIQRNKEKEITGAPSIFLCAPVEFAAKENLDNLPGTADEVNNISKLFENRNFSSQKILHSDANEDIVKQEDLKKFNLLHFATHGIVDEEHPELSRIFLSPKGSEDGSLFSGEIYNLELHANLVTLSACQTGLGKISKGEGVIGLSRALVYAGADNILVTFWNVADQSTSTLMTDFYGHLLTKFSPEQIPVSLRDAKLDMIRKGNNAEPYYWAPFILIGK